MWCSAAGGITGRCNISNRAYKKKIKSKHFASRELLCVYYVMCVVFVYLYLRFYFYFLLRSQITFICAIPLRVNHSINKKYSLPLCPYTIWIHSHRLLVLLMSEFEIEGEQEMTKGMPTETYIVHPLIMDGLVWFGRLIRFFLVFKYAYNVLYCYTI